MLYRNFMEKTEGHRLNILHLKKKEWMYCNVWEFNFRMQQKKTETQHKKSPKPIDGMAKLWYTEQKRNGGVLLSE